VVTRKIIGAIQLVEVQLMKRRLGSRCEMTVSQLRASFVREAVKEISCQLTEDWLEVQLWREDLRVL
jgi:uncharacterized coiled-coil protein SlyX